MRIKEHPILKFPEKGKIKFTLDGKEFEGRKGEPIAAALVAAGIKVLSRSIKYNRPRGFFCAIGKCSSCLMKVDGIPNIRTCITKLEKGMKIETQKGKGDFN
ncbi:MAG: (2Fe-2S)-binding protein [Candidatus Caldatribacteriota bacterium]|nr:(2Fe-2S)-binding protein [Candidatus Caldatribacteriota bacterium]